MGIADQLSTHFQGASKKDWLAVAKSETDQANPLDSLAWNTSDKLPFAPYYDADDISSLGYLQKFHFQDASQEYVPSRDWQNLARVGVANEHQANEQALHHLKHGADGIFFVLTTASVNFVTLLKGIEWPYCTVSFLVPDHFSFESLSQYIIEKKYTRLNGAIFKHTATSQEVSWYETHGIRSSGIIVRSSSPTDEIAYALTEGVRQIDHAQKNSVEDTLRSVAFSIPASGDFLLTASKIKALRLLWYQVSQAYRIVNFSPADLHIHTRTEAWAEDKFQPHGNMLKSTIATMAAVAGGCNAHTVYAEQESDSMQNRIARNTSLILKEESHFTKVADPLAGSYVIENMVHELSKTAWAKFQHQISL
ncbi:MAG TPA: methylmalonyl-CoA mutase family protein [Ohtaekwangia sp.]